MGDLTVKRAAGCTHAQAGRRGCCRGTCKLMENGQIALRREIRLGASFASPGAAELAGEFFLQVRR
jgi:hypothetical protein